MEHGYPIHTVKINAQDDILEVLVKGLWCLHDFGVTNSMRLLIPSSALDWWWGWSEDVVRSSHIANCNRVISYPVVLNDPNELILCDVIRSAVEYTIASVAFRTSRLL